jgi:hypothetical protein
MNICICWEAEIKAALMACLLDSKKQYNWKLLKQNTEIDWLRQQTLISHSSASLTSKIRCKLGWVTVRMQTHCTLSGRKGARELSWVSLVRVLIPLVRAPPSWFNHLQRLFLLIPHIRDYDSNTWICKDTNIQSTTPILDHLTLKSMVLHPFKSFHFKSFHFANYSRKEERRMVEGTERGRRKGGTQCSLGITKLHSM